MAYVPNPGMPGSPVDQRIQPRDSSSAFQPNGVVGVVIATSTTSTVTTLPRRFAGGDDCVRMYNSGTVPVRVKFGVDNTVVATNQDKAIAPGAVEVFRLGPNAMTMATYSATAGTLEIDMGAGV
jgi:hypothetical protein